VIDTAKLVSEINLQRFKSNLVCVIVFGSSIQNKFTPNDIDLCIVFKERLKDELVEVGKFIKKNFHNPDLTIYYLDELKSNLPFRDIGNGVFALDYLSGGMCLIGENIFTALLKNVNIEKYKESLLEKMFDYILRLRSVYCSSKSNKYKKDYFKKYLHRIIIDILLYNGFCYNSLSQLSREEAFQLATSKMILTPTKKNINSLGALFAIYEELNVFLINTKFK
jgi:Nucleotidyltransferase domain